MEKSIIFSYTSNCKINLGLQILNKRNDNFHNLESIFVEVDLADTLNFKKTDNFVFTSNDKHLSKLENNTIILAYQKLESLYVGNDSYSIHLEKRIPMGSGLGGGSSNAATTLKALSKAFQPPKV